MSATFGPVAPWNVRWTCDVMSESPVVTGWAVMAATEILWSMSGQRFGTNSVKLRPCRRTCRPTSFPGNVWDAMPGVGWGSLISGGGGWYGWGTIGAGCASCGDSCSCSSLSEVMLPAPVNSVTEVKMDGIVVTGSSYRVDDNRKLVRLSGAPFPYCQNLLLDDTQPGTFSVTALYGEDVPASAAGAIGELACEFIRAMHGDDCSLPPNVTSLARQGVSITLPDLTAVIEKGRLGLRMCDLFLHAYNPNGLTSRAKAYSVDGHLARRVGT